MWDGTLCGFRLWPSGTKVEDCEPSRATVKYREGKGYPGTQRSIGRAYLRPKALLTIILMKVSLVRHLQIMCYELNNYLTVTRIKYSFKYSFGQIMMSEKV